MGISLAREDFQLLETHRIVLAESDPLFPNIEPNCPTPVCIPIPNTKLKDINCEDLGLGNTYIHLGVRITVDYLAKPVPTKQELTEEQISLGVDRLQLDTHNGILNAVGVSKILPSPVKSLADGVFDANKALVEGAGSTTAGML
ncbi:tigger transposable element-derived protein 6 [Rhizoctonia solani]|uniref:Tigger transposable element-derived protein 6 n=1 Tax=Rhizoctonia solani TaxID=456999 RepID=A0A8H8SW04_9AGAM|nr:tigger transposable element-derived protein 6 [Rhizoctonia solani]QRW20516.1 tigger transposable element-derived protein 6 [Rhizoctonia solani]